ncbi:MAG: hypothetical protein J7647_07185 [Cyanobacteria bacterium SBLK]|nr:hypothetical protein [Cyanobacteria bacterium SBLK]
MTKFCFIGFIDPVRGLFYQPAFHWNCYLSWSHRDAFATGLFEYLVADCDRVAISLSPRRTSISAG